MVTKKLLKLNKEGSIGISLPKKLAAKLNWTSEDFVNITIVNNTIHVCKVKME